MKWRKVPFHAFLPSWLPSLSISLFQQGAMLFLLIVKEDELLLFNIPLGTINTHSISLQKYPTNRTDCNLPSIENRVSASARESPEWKEDVDVRPTSHGEGGLTRRISSSS